MTYNTVLDDNERRRVLNAEINPRVTTPNEGTQMLNPLTGREYQTYGNGAVARAYPMDGGIFDLHAKLARMEIRDGKLPNTYFNVESGCLDEEYRIRIAHAVLRANMGDASIITDGNGIDRLLNSEAVQKEITRRETNTLLKSVYNCKPRYAAAAA